MDNDGGLMICLTCTTQGINQRWRVGKRGRRGGCWGGERVGFTTSADVRCTCISLANLALGQLPFLDGPDEAIEVRAAVGLLILHVVT